MRCHKCNEPFLHIGALQNNKIHDTSMYVVYQEFNRLTQIATTKKKRYVYKLAKRNNTLLWITHLSSMPKTAP